ncbi:hypothetical protein ACH5RR_007438 [Cinchona calisaya]|uniref:Uncharacterized protein n=1 Tax=Cinchona calisaya TaxID=153742 RepID=A0ABD3ARR4_9GENT
MASSPSHPKLLHNPLQVFFLKSPPSSSSTQVTSSKLKNILQTFIFSHLYRIFRALTKAKSIVIHVLKDIQLLQFVQLVCMKKNSKNLKNNKLFLGSFRMHYNWCSSHVVPVPMPELQGYYSNNHLYYDSSWNTVIPSSTDLQDSSISSQLSGYLQWLEEKEDNQQGNEIDRLADMFIANSHEKFRLEKQESYRRFQEMMARSV